MSGVVAASKLVNRLLQYFVLQSLNKFSLVRRWNYGTQTTAAAGGRDGGGGEGGGTGGTSSSASQQTNTASSGIGDSVVEDIEDRRSIQFIDHVDPSLTQFDPAYQVGNCNYLL